MKRKQKDRDIFVKELVEKLEKVSVKELNIVDLRQAKPEPVADILVFFEEMAPNTNAQSPIDMMKSNYKKLDNITTDIKNHGLDEYLDYDNQGRFEFFRCEGCDGPMLGHIQSKC